MSVGFVKKGKEKHNTAQVAAWFWIFHPVISRRSLVIFRFQAAKIINFCFVLQFQTLRARCLHEKDVQVRVSFDSLITSQFLK